MPPTPSQTSTNGGVGVIGLLWVVLITLKILDKVDLSWLVILTLPIWATAIILVLVLVAIGVFALLGALFDTVRDALRKRRRNRKAR